MQAVHLFEILRNARSRTTDTRIVLLLFGRGGDFYAENIAISGRSERTEPVNRPKHELKLMMVSRSVWPGRRGERAHRKCRWHTAWWQRRNKFRGAQYNDSKVISDRNCRTVPTVHTLVLARTHATAYVHTHTHTQTFTLSHTYAHKHAHLHTLIDGRSGWCTKWSHTHLRSHANWELSER